MPGYRPIEERFWEKVQKSEDPDGCWLWTAFVGPDGYAYIGYKRKSVKAHRVSWELHYGQIPKGEGYHGTCVCHRCDVRHCVRPDHLFLGTQEENINDMKLKGRAKTGYGYGICAGTDNANAKLTEDQVREIRALRGVRKQVDVAADYGVSQLVITNIQLGKSWKHVLDENGNEWEPYENSSRIYGTRTVRYKGQDLTLRELSEAVGVSAQTLKDRIFKCKWDIERAVTTPVKTKLTPVADL